MSRSTRQCCVSANKNDGFLRVAAASPQIRVADVEGNAEVALAAVRRAAERGIRALVLPELNLCGYTAADLFHNRTLLHACEAALVHILDETRELPVVFTIGLPVAVAENIYNCAAVCCAGELLGVQAVGIELNAHCAKIGHDLVELRRAGELRDGSEPFGGLLRRRADAGELWGSGTGGLPGGTKPGTGGFPGGPKLLKPLRGNPSGLRRPAEVRLDLLQGSVNDGKIAGRFLRAVRPYLNSYRRRVVHGLPLVFLLRFSVSAAWADKKAVSMLRKVRIS